MVGYSNHRYLHSCGYNCEIYLLAGAFQAVGKYTKASNHSSDFTGLEMALYVP